MSDRKAEKIRQSIQSAHAKLAIIKASAWLRIESKSGRVYLVARDLKCREAAVDFVDDDDWRIALPYDQIACVEIQRKTVNGLKRHRSIPTRRIANRSKRGVACRRSAAHRS